VPLVAPPVGPPEPPVDPDPLGPSPGSPMEPVHAGSARPPIRVITVDQFRVALERHSSTMAKTSTPLCLADGKVISFTVAELRLFENVPLDRDIYK
jgi:hypothetical protein